MPKQAKRYKDSSLPREPVELTALQSQVTDLLLHLLTDMISITFISSIPLLEPVHLSQVIPTGSSIFASQLLQVTTLL
jgi:hypothetical protein